MVRKIVPSHTDKDYVLTRHGFWLPSEVAAKLRVISVNKETKPRLCLYNQITIRLKQFEFFNEIHYSKQSEQWFSRFVCVPSKYKTYPNLISWIIKRFKVNIKAVYKVPTKPDNIFITETFLIATKKKEKK